MKLPRTYSSSPRKSWKYPGLVGAVFFALAWEALARLVGNAILLPGPLAVTRALGLLAVRADFWLALAFSLASVLAGFFTSIVLAVGSGLLNHFVPRTEALFAPILSILKSAPLAALTIILMIWLEPKAMPFALIVLAVTPPVYSSTCAGLAGTSQKLLEMAFVFRFRRSDKIKAIYLPALLKQLLPSLEYTSGLAWKAGVTGEILAQPFRRLGSGLYEAKILLESAEVLAYLAVILLLSYGLGRILELAAHRLSAGASTSAQLVDTPLESPEALPDTPIPLASSPAASMTAISVRGLTKRFGDKVILKDFAADIPAAAVSVIAGPSGRGKSTFFRLLMGLSRADQGTIDFRDEMFPDGNVRFACAFQESRLLEQNTVAENLLMAAGLRKADPQTKVFLAHWEPLIAEHGLPADQAVRYFSGGMKQKVSLLRALASPSDILILDEVFRELDPAAEAKLLQLFLREKGTRTVLLATHRGDLIEQTAGTVIYLSDS